MRPAKFDAGRRDKPCRTKALRGNKPEEATPDFIRGKAADRPCARLHRREVVNKRCGSVDNAALRMHSPPETRPGTAPQAQATLTQRLARMRPYFAGSGRGVAAMALAAVLAAATEVAIPWMIGQLLDRGFGPQRGFSLWVVPILLVSVFALRGVADFVSQYAGSWIVNHGLLRLRSRVFDRLLHAAPDLFSKHSASSLTNTVVYEAQTGATLLVGSVQTTVRDAIKIAGLLIYLLTLNWQLTLSVLLLAPAVSWGMRFVSRRLQRITVDAQRATDELAYVVEENVNAWKLVRLHEASGPQQQRFDTRSKVLRGLSVKSSAAAALSSPITQLISAVALSAVIVAALWQGAQGQTTMGGFVAFVTSMLLLVAPMKHLSDVVAPMTRGLTALERGLDLIDHQAMEQGGDHQAVKAQGSLRFDAVSLRYGQGDACALALDQVSLHAQPGQVVALVGPSGGGKTSLVSLVPRFLQPTSGVVTLDGVPLADWNLAKLRRQMALVSQDVVFFNDTVAANVALGAALDEARVRQALTDANLIEHVDRLPQGMHTLVGHNATQFSGGQRQRLAIARAIYKDAPVLILDEATSALDSQSERAVQTALERLMKGRTTIVIAHRLATVEHADWVAVMDQGRIVEQGSPQELKAHGGLYAQLHAMQFRPSDT